MEVGDGELVARYRAGDVGAMGVLVERYRRHLFGFILNVAGDDTDAEEIFQEVWFRAIRKIDGYREGSFVSWLIRICRNLLIDRWRGRRKFVSLDERADDTEGWDSETRLAARDPSPSEQVGTSDMAVRAAMAVDRLPPEQKEVVVMRVRGGLSFKDIAAAQGVSINTALARMHYALAKLREGLKGEYALP